MNFDDTYRQAAQRSAGSFWVFDNSLFFISLLLSRGNAFALCNHLQKQHRVVFNGDMLQNGYFDLLTKP